MGTQLRGSNQFSNIKMADTQLEPQVEAGADVVEKTEELTVQEVSCEATAEESSETKEEVSEEVEEVSSEETTETTEKDAQTTDSEAVTEEQTTKEEETAEESEVVE